MSESIRPFPHTPSRPVHVQLCLLHFLCDVVQMTAMQRAIIS